MATIPGLHGTQQEWGKVWTIDENGQPEQVDGWGYRWPDGSLRTDLPPALAQQNTEYNTAQTMAEAQRLGREASERNTAQKGAKPPTATTGGDIYAPFKAAYNAYLAANPAAASGWGPLTEQQMSSWTFLKDLPNELLTKLPPVALSGAPTSVLAKFENKDLLAFLRSTFTGADGKQHAGYEALPGFDVARIANLGLDYANEVQDYLTTHGRADLAKQIKDEATRLSTTTTNTTTTGGAGAGTKEEQIAKRYAGIKTLNELFPNGGSPDFAAAAKTDPLAMEYYLPFGGSTANDPRRYDEATGNRIASENFVRTMGLNPTAGNPFASFVEGQISPEVDLAGAYNSLYSTPDGGNGMGRDLNNVVNWLGASGQGGASADPNKFFGDLNSMLSQKAAGGTLTSAQDELASKLNNPNTAFDLVNRARRRQISPFLQGSAEQAQSRLYSDFLRQAPQNTGQNFFQWLTRPRTGWTAGAA